MIIKTVELSDSQISLLQNLLGWLLDQAHDSMQAGTEEYLEDDWETSEDEVFAIIEAIGPIPKVKVELTSMELQFVLDTGYSPLRPIEVTLAPQEWDYTIQCLEVGSGTDPAENEVKASAAEKIRKARS